MALHKDAHGRIHDDMGGAALSLTSWPEGLTPLSDAEVAAFLAAASAPVVPQIVLMYQMQRALLNAGRLAELDAAIAAMSGTDGDAVRLDWRLAPTVARDSILAAAIVALLSLADADMDALFVAAANIN